MDDSALLKRWTRRRDAEAFHEIVERFADQVFATCRRIVRNEADAEDVAQECFLQLVRSGGEIRTSLGGWLHGVATNKSRERVRSEVSRRNREEAYASQSNRLAEASWDDIQSYVDSALEALPPATRDVIVAHFIGRKSQAEIAAELRLSPRAVSHRIQRGLASMRRELGKWGVTASAAVIGTSLAADAGAAPVSLKASLGRLAIAVESMTGAGGATASSVVLGSLIIMKTKLAVVCVVLCLVAAILFVVYVRTWDDGPGLPSDERVESVEPVVAESTEGPEATGGAVPAAASESEKAAPTLEELLALSRAELERSLEQYPAIADPQQYASISGTVLDRDGYPVAGASVLLTPASHWGKLPRTDAMSRAVRSGADGAYAIEDIQFEGSFWVNATKAGYADAARGSASDSPISIEAGMKATGIDFTLDYGPTLYGQVLSADGIPVPDGIVHGLSVTGPNSASMMQRYSARTDEGGYFTMGFEEDARGSVTSLRVQSAMYGSGAFPDVVIQEERPIELRLTAPAVIYGVVRYGDGGPVPGARLNFYGNKRVVVPGADGGEPWDKPSFGGWFVAVGDPEGRYAVEVDAGLDYAIEVKAGGAGENEEREQIPALYPRERREHDVVLDANQITVRGRIIGMPSGKAFDSYVALVSVYARRGEDAFVGSANMNAEGGYELLLPGEPGEYTFQAGYFFAKELSGEESAPQHLEGGDELELDVKLPEPQYFSIRVVDAEGNPLAGVSANALTERYGTYNANVRTNEAGRLDRPFAMPPNSGARIYVEQPGYATTWGTLFDHQGAGTVHPEEVIVLRPAAGFEGVLVDGAGNPVVNALLTVSVTNSDGQVWAFEVRTDGAGHFTIVDRAPADVVDISIKDEGGGVWSAEGLELEANAIAMIGDVVLE